jgi:hypothetical protein
MFQETWERTGPSASGVRPVAPAPRKTAASFVYTDIRSQIRTGDILLFQGTSPISRLIRWGSGSDYSHAGFAAWWDGRLLVFQASGRGAEVLPASSAVDAYDGQVDWFALDDEHHAKVDRHELVTTAVTLLGRAYSRLGLVQLMLRMARGRFRGLADAKVGPDAVFCSQYVSYCYRHAGLDLVEGTDDGSTSPADLARSPFLIRRGVLRANQIEKEGRKSIEIPGRPRGQLKK